MKSFKNTLLTAMAVIGISVVSFAQDARVQVIHNSADQAAKVVDIWMDDQLLIDNFEFRTATPFIDAPAGEEFVIAVQPSNSTSSKNPIWSQTFVLGKDETYVLVANGIVSPDGYNPATPFDIYVYGMGRETASFPGNTDVIAFHGSTDAPVVDVVEVSIPAGTLVDDLAYSNFAGYLELPTSDYVLQLRDASGTTPVAEYQAPLAGLGLQGQSVTLLASGFMNPQANSNGPDFGMFAALASGGELIPLPQLEVSTARAQFIHNAPDFAAQIVDIYVNGQLFVDDFSFRSSTPFEDVPANVNLTVSVVEFTSSNGDNPLWSKDVIFEGGEKYIVVANGIVNPEGYSPVEPFDIYAFPQAMEMGSSNGYTDILVHHGVTDAPAIDILDNNTGFQLVDDIEYGEYQGYFTVPSGDYILQITDASGADEVGLYEAPLSSYNAGGEAITIVASGFLFPEENNNGPDFGLYVAMADGGNLIPLPEYQSMEYARVQVIHNSADLAAREVDVWLNDQLLIDDFTFRTATPFIDAPAGVDFDISIQPANSSDTTGALAKFTYNLAPNGSYILVANGIVSSNGYDPVKPFDIYVYPAAREAAGDQNVADVLVFHGSTDAPTVDVVEVGVGAGTIVDDLMYSDFAGYLSLPVDDYSLQIRDESGTLTVAQYAAPIETLGLGGEAFSVIASGFLAPENNNNGEAFGLYIALASGGELIPLPSEATGTASVQVIHNSADAAAEMVDVWLNDQLLIDDFTFRTATPFVEAPAGVDFDIVIQPSNSSDTSNALARFTYNLQADMSYLLVANGIVIPDGYDPLKPFDLYAFPDARESATSSGNTDVIVFHGSTDAPTVDVVETGAGAGTIIDDMMYGEYRGYLELPTADYVLDIMDENQTVTVASYAAPLANLGLEGQAITVLASGFLNPSINNDGPAFGLYVALASGGELIPLGLTTDVAETVIDEESVMAYPNPAVNYLNVSAGFKAETPVSAELYSLIGNRVGSYNFGTVDGLYNERLDVSGLSEGLYLLRINAGQDSITQKIRIVK